MKRFGLVVLVSLGACQTYDFEPVAPILVGQTTDKVVIAARRLRPNVMLLVDRSLSMLRPIEPTDPACPAGCGSSAATVCPEACPTRLSELKRAMNTFFESSGELARFGLTQFPTSSLCQPADLINVPFPAGDRDDKAALVAGAEQVNRFVQSIAAMGGTPTGASLDFVGEYSELNADDGRDDLVLLLTDGLPNCNEANASALCGCSAGGNVCSAAQVASCACTGNCVGSMCSLGCLDREGVVEKVKKLRSRRIRTAVIGFGADLLTGEGPEVLEAMAREGGFSSSYFHARDALELSAALKSIIVRVPVCSFDLSARPSDERLLSVLVEGQTVREGPDTYAYDFATNRVTFLGTTCERLSESTAQHPVQVEFRIVERF